MAGSVFQNKWFVLYFLTSCASQIGTQVYRLAIPWLVLEMTDSVVSMSAMFVVETAPFILLGPILGVFIDRFDRRRIMIVSDFARAVLVSIIPVLAALGYLELWHLYLIGFALSIFSILFDLVVDFSLLPNLVEKTQLTAANSVKMSIQSLSSLLGPAVAGATIAMAGAKNAFIIDAASYFLTLLFVFLLPVNLGGNEPTNIRKLTVATVVSDMKNGFAFLARSPILRVLIANSFLVNLALGALFTVMTYRLGHELQLSSFIVGSVYSILGGMALLGSLLAPYLLRIMPLGRSLAFAYLIAFAGIVLLAAVPDWRIALFGYGLINAAMSISNIYTFTIRQREIPAEYIGRVNATYRMFLVLAFPFSAAVLGGLANSFGAKAAFICSAIIMTVVVSFTFLSSIPRYKEKRETVETVSPQT
ncbi:MFS transporter [Brevibacillus sp. H7]|uniref:MFS transporter n=1 Tax=Brevibacillus sp. H7 TaxID=3349138 RepID=UPI0038213B98